MKLAEALGARFGDASDKAEDETLAPLAGRGSCRAFRREPLPSDLLRTLAGVALSAPSKSDLQLRDIVVLTKGAARDRLDAVAGFDWLPIAPAMFVFIANIARHDAVHEQAGVPKANEHFDLSFNAFVDAGVALGYCVAAAELIGLGACPLSVIRNQPEEVAAALKLPDRTAPVAGLALGWPERPPRIQPRLGLDATVHEGALGEPDAGITDYDARRGWPGRRRDSDRFGDKADYGWSDDKARQYADPQREDWGAFLRARGFPMG